MGIIDLIFPKLCLGCGKSGGYFCQNCLAKVKTTPGFDPISKTLSIFKYEGVIRKGIIKLKYNFAYDIGEELAGVCFEKLRENPYLSFKNAVLIPIPIHESRQNWRGFNQSEILGRFLAKSLNWDFEKDLLVRPIGGQNQVGLAKSERVRNIRGKFAVNAHSIIPSAVEGNTITYIIFDDVATTGSTIREAIKVLKENGAKKVFGLTLAK